MANFQAFPPAGSALPKDWQAQASAANAAFMANYQAKMDEAWRQPLTSTNSSLAQAARLTNKEPPAPPNRNDARSDARFDGKMTLVSDSEEEQVWRDFNGSTIVIKKRK